MKFKVGDRIRRAKGLPKNFYEHLRGRVGLVTRVDGSIFAYEVDGITHQSSMPEHFTLEQTKTDAERKPKHSVDGSLILSFEKHCVQYEPGAMTGGETVHLSLKLAGSHVVPIHIDEIDNVCNLLQKMKTIIRTSEM